MINKPNGSRMQLPVDLLKTFTVVADTRNFTDAGKQVHLSQSAVSMQMKRLAEVVGQPLFDITGKQIRLSTMGELLLEHAHKILTAHEAAAAEIKRSKSKGKIRFDAPEDYASLFIPEILLNFAKVFPDIRVDLLCEPSDRLYNALLQDRLDLAVCTEIDKGGELIHREPVVWISAANFRNKNFDSVPLAVYNHNCIYRKWAIDALNETGRPFHIAYMSPGISGILAAVESGLAVAPVGLSVVPEWADILDNRHGFPKLPTAGVRLYQSSEVRNSFVDNLSIHVRKTFMNCSPVTD